MRLHDFPVAIPWLFAALLPASLAFSGPPDTSFYNVIVAVAGWGAALLWFGRALAVPLSASAIGICGLVGVLAGGAWIAGEGSRVLALVAACGGLGWTLGQWPQFLQRALTSLLTGYGLAGGVALLICALQYFFPGWADAGWVTPSSTAGRAVGNLRQPNQQATMLIWSAIATAWLAGQYAPVRRIFPLVLAGVIFAVALTGSRTGMALTGLLLLWGWRDSLLPSRVRGALIAAPFLLWISMQALSFWAHQMGVSYFVDTRAQSGSDISSSRFAIWSNTLELIQAQPWTGVGWGEFNFAWTLTAFPHRPMAFFDHTHNLPLQIAVELGVPAAVLICGGGPWLLWRARGVLVSPNVCKAGIARTVLMMLAAVLFHSLLEYPLWYAYFLLPTAFLVGLYLSLGWRTPIGEGITGKTSHKLAGNRSCSLLGWAGLSVGAVMLFGALYALWDYQRITQIFAPRYGGAVPPLQERIREGQQSRLFGAHADYAAVTTAARPSEVFAAFERPLHRLIDARLMVAYARALEERGERDKAVYVAQRLREFRHPLGDQFFAPCSTQPSAGEILPFQCETVPVRLSYRDFEASGGP